MVRPCHRRSRQEQDKRVDERQAPGIERFNAFGRPHAVGEVLAEIIAEESRIAVRVEHLRAVGENDRLARVGEKRGAEKRPEPRREEHDFRGDEQDHAVAKAKPDDEGRIFAPQAFLDDVAPPADHRDKDAGEAEQEQPVAFQLERIFAGVVRGAQHKAGFACARTHPGDGARHHNGRGQRADDRPRARIDEMVVVLDLSAGHGFRPLLVDLPLSITFCGAEFQAPARIRRCDNRAYCAPRAAPAASVSSSSQRKNV